jgi:hypothetical protein
MGERSAFRLADSCNPGRLLDEAGAGWRGTSWMAILGDGPARFSVGSALAKFVGAASC